jgi:Tfp pilus assembly protein PilF
MSAWRSLEHRSCNYCTFLRTARRSILAFAAAVCTCTAIIAITTLSGTAGAAAENASLAAPAAPFKSPYTPASDREVLQDVPARADPAVERMKQLRAAAGANPASLPAAKQLADAYIDYSRQIGDAHFAGYAEAVIAPWVLSPNPPATALVTQAVILQYRHEFDAARTLLGKALKADPFDAQAWLTLGTLDLVQGDHEAAAKDCSRVSNTADPETGLACFASLRSRTGQAKQSLIALQQVEIAARRAPASYRAWVEGLLAESAERLGDWSLAESHYRNALDLTPQDNFLLVAYADLLLDRSRPREVLPLLANHTQSDTAFLRLALAQAALRSEQVPRYTWIMAARFEALRLRGSDYFGREESRFALQLQHDPQAALEMALRNWQMQREPWDARVALEAALAAGQPQAAAPVLEFLAKTKLEDPILEPMVQDLRAQLNSTGAGR